MCVVMFVFVLPLVLQIHLPDVAVLFVGRIFVQFSLWWLFVFLLVFFVLFVLR